MNIVLRQGSRGQTVRKLQDLLRKHGADITADGDFGPATRAALVAFQDAKGLVPDGIVGEQTWEALMGKTAAWPDAYFEIDGHLIEQQPLREGQYIEAFSRKRQIVLHHTAGGPDPVGAIRWWNHDPSPIGTAFVIGGWGKHDGKIVQAFDDRAWAWHLGMTGKPRQDAVGIGIELCNWGFLTPTTDGRFVNWAGGYVLEKHVCELPRPWRGFRYFHAYSPAQLDATRALIAKLRTRWGIPVQTAFGAAWFEIDENARDGRPGIWNHTNYRTDKTDLSPQPALIDMLNSL